MSQALQKCSKRFKVTPFKYQNVSGRIAIKMLIMVVAEDIISQTPLDSEAPALGVHTACGQHPLRLLDPIHTESRRCLGIMSPGVAVSHWPMGAQDRYGGFLGQIGAAEVTPELPVGLSQRSLCATLLAAFPSWSHIPFSFS